MSIWYLVLSTGRRAPEKFRLDVVQLQSIRSHPQGCFVDARGHTFQQLRRVTGTTKIVHLSIVCIEMHKQTMARSKQQ